METWQNSVSLLLQSDLFLEMILYLSVRLLLENHADHTVRAERMWIRGLLDCVYDAPQSRAGDCINLGPAELAYLCIPYIEVSW